MEKIITNNADDFIALLKKDPTVLSSVSFHHDNPEDVAYFLTIVTLSPELYIYFPKHARINKKIINAFLEEPMNCSLTKDENNFFILFLSIKPEETAQAFLKYLPSELKNSKRIFNWLVNKNGRYLLYASDLIKNDKNIVIKAVRNTQASIVYASKELRGNHDVIKELFKSKLYFRKRTVQLIFDHIERSLLNDTKILKIIFKSMNYQVCHILPYITKEMKNDKEFMISILKSNDFFASISRDLRKDKDVIIVSIKHNYSNISYIDMKSFENDEDFFFRLIKSHPRIILEASKKLRKNNEFIKKCFKINIKVFDYLLPDEEMIWKISSWNASLIAHLKNYYKCKYNDKYDHLYKNRDFVLQCYQTDHWNNYFPYFYHMINPEFKDDKKLTLEALKRAKYSTALFFKIISDKNLKDKDFIKKCIEIRPNYLKLDVEIQWMTKRYNKLIREPVESLRISNKRVSSIVTWLLKLLKNKMLNEEERNQLIIL
eukprot:gene12624-6528_t